VSARSGHASPYLTVENVAEMLGCSVRTVHERTRLGEIPHRKPPGGRRCLFLEPELRAWLDGTPLVTTELPRGGRVVKPC
jgi:excisionase family DNA binding protein